MNNIEELLKNLPDTYQTDLDSQILYMETVNRILRTPLSISILNSLKELKGINRNKYLK
jgi:hypothetical protein